MTVTLLKQVSLWRLVEYSNKTQAHRGGKSTKIFYSSKSAITSINFT